LLATRYLKAQKNLHHSFLLILPSLISLGVDVDVLLYPMILLILLSLGVDVNVLLYPIILLILPSLGVTPSFPVFLCYSSDLTSVYLIGTDAVFTSVRGNRDKLTAELVSLLES